MSGPLSRFVETVAVERRTQAGTDRLGNPVWEWSDPVEVDALVAPATSDEMGAERPDGESVDMTVAVPSTLTGSLRGARVTLRGRAMRVVGDPEPVTGSPLPFDRIVDCRWADG